MSRAAHQGSMTLSSMWTMTRNEPELEALSPTGLASMELIVTVLTMPSTGKHSLTPTDLPDSLNPAILTHRAIGLFHSQGDLCLVRCPELVPLPLQESYGAGLVVEPACPRLHRALPFSIQIVTIHHSGFAGSCWALLYYRPLAFS